MSDPIEFPRIGLVRLKLIETVAPCLNVHFTKGD